MIPIWEPSPWVGCRCNMWRISTPTLGSCYSNRSCPQSAFATTSRWGVRMPPMRKSGAARAAQILDDIEALPSGMDSIYGPEIGLSGGQARRISIARAILTDAPVLILDEATALTDPESQHHIQ